MNAPDAPPTHGYDTETERHLGPEWTKELLALKHVELRERLANSGPADLVRDSHPEYWSADRPPMTRAEALAALAAAIPNLTRSEAGHAANLISFAVHTEMKHWADPEYVTHPDHQYELLIEPGDYTSWDDLVDRGQEENCNRWASLANIAATHALAADAAIRRAA